MAELGMLTPERIAESGSESAHQQALMAWAAIQVHWGNTALKWLYAIPNGGLRTARNAATLKAEGVKSGVADLFLMQPAGEWHGLYIEMKEGNKQLSENQVEFSTDANERGYLCRVCYTWEEARDLIVWYLGHLGMQSLGEVT